MTPAKLNIRVCGFRNAAIFSAIIAAALNAIKCIIDFMYDSNITNLGANIYVQELLIPFIASIIFIYALKKFINIGFEDHEIKILGKIFEKKNITKYQIFDDFPKNFDSDNDDITLKVYRRLKLRYGVLKSVLDDAKEIEIVRRRINFNKELENPKNDPGQTIISERLYKIVTTDLFVEKALSYLNRKARKYERYAFFLIILIFILLSLAIGYSLFAVRNNDFDKFEKFNIAILWAQISIVFIKNFTFYGIIFIAVSFLYRMVKSLFDQAERIKDRRHALRQGRLYVHLKDGEVDLKEMKEVFNWNTIHPNAFSEFNPDAQAPFGALLKEFFTTIREGIKSAKS